MRPGRRSGRVKLRQAVVWNCWTNSTSPTGDVGPLAVSSGRGRPRIAAAAMPGKATCRLTNYPGRRSPVWISHGNTEE